MQKKLFFSRKNYIVLVFFEKMNILALDYGHRRIGIAYADSDIAVAVPVKAAVQQTEQERVNFIIEEIKLRRIQKIVVGYPLNMDGTVSDKAREVDAFIEKYLLPLILEIVRVDERLSSYQAEQDIANFSRKKVKSVAARKKNRKTGEVDSRAASIFLQEYLDSGMSL